MNDYEFGNYLYTLRGKAGLTQKELARHLGVTNKAVSKWETGKAKPTTNTLRKMAALFGLSAPRFTNFPEEPGDCHVAALLAMTAFFQREVFEYFKDQSNF